MSMILCFHQRKLQVESCKCSGSFFGQSIYNFSALSALTSKERGPDEHAKCGKSMDGTIPSFHLWCNIDRDPRHETRDVWSRDERAEGTLWCDDQTMTTQCHVSCVNPILCGDRNLCSEGRSDTNWWLRHEHKASHLSLSQLRRLNQTLWLSYFALYKYVQSFSFTWKIKLKEKRNKIRELGCKVS